MNIPGFSSRPRSALTRSVQFITQKIGALLPFKRRSPHPEQQRLLRRVGGGLATTAAAAAAYRYLFQPWHRTWGATRTEVEQSLPGDGLVPHPAYSTTRAISIDAPPKDVWPWLAQMGQGRGGFYSYDWLENLFGLEIQNADHVVPEWQDLAPGDTVRLAPSEVDEDRAKMRVVHLEPNRALVFGPVVDTPEDLEDAFRTGAGTWAFVLEPSGDGGTRLIVRTRSRPWQAPRPVFALYDPIHFLMERKMMIGIKRRAETEHRPEKRAGDGDGQQVPAPTRL